MTRDKPPRFCDLNTAFKYRDSLVSSTVKGKRISEMKRDESKSNRTVSERAGSQSSLE
jgi:hypothetical protein